MAIFFSSVCNHSLGAGGWTTMWFWGLLGAGWACITMPTGIAPTLSHAAQTSLELLILLPSSHHLNAGITGVLNASQAFCPLSKPLSRSPFPPPSAPFLLLSPTSPLLSTCQSVGIKGLCHHTSRQGYLQSLHVTLLPHSE